MTPAGSFDPTHPDSQAMPVTPLEPDAFDYDRYEDHLLACEARYADFLNNAEGVAVWQRVRVEQVFRDGCRNIHQSLCWQLGGLTESLTYRSDVHNVLEPWYGIGMTASAYGAGYIWPEGQAPVVENLYADLPEASALVASSPGEVPIQRHTLEMIAYFLDRTAGRLPICWADIQAPLNVASQIINSQAFFRAFYDSPERVEALLSSLIDPLIAFIQEQSQLIGSALARPGHGFASARIGRGVGLSEDNLVLISPEMYGRFCVPQNTAIGDRFGGVSIHCCGNWGAWLEVVRQIPNLLCVDAAFGPFTDPKPNRCEVFREAFAHTGIILQARIVGSPEEVLAQVRKLWASGMRLVVVTNVRDQIAQNRLYEDIHQLCL